MAINAPRKIRCPLKTVLLVICALLLSLHLPCSNRVSPEDEIHSWLEQAVKAAERRDVKSLRNLVSEDYSDDEGRDKKLIHGILVYHLLHNRSIYILRKVKNIKFIDPRAAELTVMVAVAGQPIGSGVNLRELEADLLRFSFMLRKDNGDNWRVITAKWDSVEITEFI